MVYEHQFLEPVNCSNCAILADEVRRLREVAEAGKRVREYVDPSVTIDAGAACAAFDATLDRLEKKE